MGWYPKSGEPLVLQGGSELLLKVEAFAGKGIPLVLLDLEAAKPEKGIFRVPSSASLVDLLAAIAHAQAFVGSSPHGRFTAQAFGVPAVEPSEDLDSALAAVLAAGRPCGSPPDLERSLKAGFDRIATEAEEGLRWRLRVQHGESIVAVLVDALRASERRAAEMERQRADERLEKSARRIRLLEQLEDRREEAARLEEALRALETRAQSAEDEREALRAEYLRFTSSRLYRYSRPLRGIYGGLLRALGQKKGESR